MEYRTHLFQIEGGLSSAKNRFIGAKKVLMHVYSCLIAYVISYAR